MSDNKAILAAANATLQRSDYAACRELTVDMSDDGSLVVRGAVHSFFHKQLAQEMLRGLAIEHRLRIVNRIDVMDALSI